MLVSPIRLLQFATLSPLPIGSGTSPSPPQSRSQSVAPQSGRALQSSKFVTPVTAHQDRSATVPPPRNGIKSTPAKHVQHTPAIPPSRSHNVSALRTRTIASINSERANTQLNLEQHLGHVTSREDEIYWTLGTTFEQHGEQRCGTPSRLTVGSSEEVRRGGELIKRKKMVEARGVDAKRWPRCLAYAKGNQYSAALRYL